MNPEPAQRPVMNKYMLLLFACTLVSAGLPVQSTYILTKAYAVSIAGTSNLRDWKDSVGNVTGDMVANVNGDGSVDLHAIHIKMEVRSIRSDMGPAMDSKTYNALKADANPEILFILTAAVKLMQVHPGEHSLFVKGNLTLAGVSRPVIMQVNSFTIEKGKLQFEGVQKISMTDYGVKPPTALFGTIKARPDIIIYFKTNFTNKQSE
jgi:polyisoprenoid-binding protein YceI